MVCPSSEDAAPHHQGRLRGRHCLVPSSLCEWATGRCQRHKAALGQWKQSEEREALQEATMLQEKVSEEDVQGWGGRGAVQGGAFGSRS